VLDDANVFARVVECGNFSKAARDLNITPSSVSKRILRLEEELDAPLLYRNTRGVQLTAQGEVYYRLMRDALDKSIEAAQAVRELSTSMQGVIQIAAGPSFTSHVLAPALAAFVNEHPDISVHVSVRTDPISAASEGADLMFQWGELKDSNLVAKHIMSEALVTVCSPSFFEAKELGDAGREEIFAHWISTTDNYVPGSVLPSFDEEQEAGFRQIVVNDVESVLAIVLAGAGVTVLPRFAVRDKLAAAALVEIPDATSFTRLEGYAVTHVPPSQNPRIQAFLDYVIREISEKHSG